MLMQEATPEMVDTWKSVYAEYRARLTPNRKPAQQIIDYLKGQYPVAEVTDENWKQIVIDNVMSHECHSEKLPAGRAPTAVVFFIQNTGAGKRLYEKQDALFKAQTIFAGIELETGFFHVEGSRELWDELFAFRGLDKTDLCNFYLVAEYVSCLKRFGMLNEVLTPVKQG